MPGDIILMATDGLFDNLDLGKSHVLFDSIVSYCLNLDFYKMHIIHIVLYQISVL